MRWFRSRLTRLLFVTLLFALVVINFQSSLFLPRTNEVLGTARARAPVRREHGALRVLESPNGRLDSSGVGFGDTECTRRVTTPPIPAALPPHSRCGSTKDHAYGSTTPECEVLFGEYDKRLYQGPHVTGIPICYRRSSMERELQRWLFNSSIFNVPESDLHALGFLSDLDDIEYTDGRRAGPHRYYEGYFHGLRQSAPHLSSSHPRYGLKRTLDKPPASGELRAFLSELRRVNPWMRVVASELADEMRLRLANCSSEISASFETLIALFSRPDAMFSDLAVQVHFGQEQAPIWHNDGVNSILHLALSIHGNRELRMQLHRGPEDAPDAKHRVNRVNGATMWDGAEERIQKFGKPRRDFSHIDWRKQFVNPLTPGDVYVSSPTGFIHGVHYPTCSYDDRIIAVQCRLLMTRDELSAMQQLDVDDWLHIIETRVTPVLQRAELTLPSFSDVYETFEECMRVK